MASVVSHFGNGHGANSAMRDLPATIYQAQAAPATRWRLLDAAHPDAATLSYYFHLKRAHKIWFIADWRE